MDIKIGYHKKGDGGLLCMPLVRNLPDADKTHDDWEKTSCPSCGCACWESDTHRKLLDFEKDVKAVCTICALKIGVRRI